MSNASVEKLIVIAGKYHALGWVCGPCYLYWHDNKKLALTGKWKHLTKDIPFTEIRKNFRRFKTWESSQCPGIPLGQPPNSIFIVTGAVSGITVIDLDGDIKTCLNHLEQMGFKIRDDHMTFDTPKGQHLICKHSPEIDTFIKTTVKPFGDHIPIDIRSQGGIIFAPGSSYIGADGELCEYKVHKINNPKIYPIPISVVQSTVLYQKGLQDYKNDNDYCYMTLDELKNVLKQLILKHPNNRPNYDEWLRLISSVWSAYDFDETLPILQELMPEEKPGEYKTKFESRLKDYHMGSIIKAARDHGIPLPERDFIEVKMGVTSDGTPIVKRVKQEKIQYQYGKQEPVEATYREIMSDSEIRYKIDMLPPRGSFKRVDNLCEEAEMLKPGDILMLFAPPGSRKSILMMESFNRMSLGLPFWNDTYTPKRPIRTIYFHADRNMEKFETDYLPKLTQPNYDNILYVYIQDFFRWPVLEDVNFDLKNTETKKLIRDFVNQFKPDCLVFDSWANCATSMDFNKTGGMPAHLKFLNQFAAQTNVIIWLIHHSNKRTDVKLKQQYIGADDYGGVRSIAASVAASFIVNPSLEKSDQPGTFYLSMGKEFTKFTKLKYRVINKMIDNKDKIIFDFIETEESKIEPESRDSDKFKLSIYHHMRINKYKMLCSEVKKNTGVGTVWTLRSYHYFIDKMKKEGLLISSGKTSLAMYELTEKGRVEALAIETIPLDMTASDSGSISNTTEEISTVETAKPLVDSELTTPTGSTLEPPSLKYDGVLSERAQKIEDTIDIFADNVGSKPPVIDEILSKIDWIN